MNQKGKKWEIFTHEIVDKFGLIFPHDSNQVDWNTQNSNQKSHSNDHRFNIKRHQDQKGTNDEEGNRYQNCNSDWSWHVRLFPT